MYNRGERDAYAGLGVQFEQSYLPELFITERDGAALDPPASVLLTEDGSCHLEMAELHALMAKEGFVKKPASQLRDEHAAQFAAFKRRVLAFYRAHAPAKLDDAAFAPNVWSPPRDSDPQGTVLGQELLTAVNPYRIYVVGPGNILGGPNHRARRCGGTT